MVDRANVPTINSVHICSHKIHLLAVCALVLQWNPIFLSYAMILNEFRLRLGPLSMGQILTFQSTKWRGKTRACKWSKGLFYQDIACNLTIYVAMKDWWMFTLSWPPYGSCKGIQSMLVVLYHPQLLLQEWVIFALSRCRFPSGAAKRR